MADRAAAQRLFAHALALNPSDGLTHLWFATALLANGEPEAALKQIEITRALNPTGTADLADRGLIVIYARHRAEGLAARHTLVTDQPQAVAPHRYLAFGDTTTYLRGSATAARLCGDDAALAQLDRWRIDGAAPEMVKTAMLRSAA